MSETTLRQEHTNALLGAGVSHSDGFAFDAQRIRLLQATSDLDRPGILSLAAAFRPGCCFMFSNFGPRSLQAIARVSILASQGNRLFRLLAAVDSLFSDSSTVKNG